MRNYEEKTIAENDILGPWHQAVLSKVDFSGKRVLDVGAGTGRFLEAARKSGAQVHGIDPNPKNCAMLDKLGISNNVGYLTKGSEIEADIVTCFEVIEHVYDPNPIIDAARSVLGKTKGTLIVSTPNTFNAMRAIKFVIHQRHHDPLMDPVLLGEDAEHVRAYSFGMVTDLLRNHGFTNIRPLLGGVMRRYLAHNIVMAAEVA